MYPRDKYTYVCNGSGTSCEICTALDGQHFAVDEAEEDINLPPMHPNCRCTIEGYPPSTELSGDLDTRDTFDRDELEHALNSMLGKPESLLDNAVDFVSSLVEVRFQQEHPGILWRVHDHGNRRRGLPYKPQYLLRRGGRTRRHTYRSEKCQAVR